MSHILQCWQKYIRENPSTTQGPRSGESSRKSVKLKRIIDKSSQVCFSEWWKKIWIIGLAQWVADDNLPNFQNCDSNKDYKLSWDETSKCAELTTAGIPTEDSFNNADDDGDNVVSFPELLKVILDNITGTLEFLINVLLHLLIFWFFWELHPSSYLRGVC